MRRCVFPSLFFTLISVFTLNLGSIDYIHVGIKKEAGDDEMGPNDASSVVWALGVFFLERRGRKWAQTPF